MDKIIAYVRLHLRITGAKSTRGSKDKIATGILSFATCVVMLFILHYFLQMVDDQFGKFIDILDFSTLLLTVSVLALTVTCISYEIKEILSPSDLKIVARFPMSEFQTFVAEIIIAFVRMLVTSIFVCAPIMAVFGLAIGVFSLEYLLRVVLTSVFAAVFSFGLGTLLAVPVMYVKSILQNKNLLKIILFVAVLSTLLLLYDYILNMIAEYFISQRISAETVSVISDFVVGLNSWFNPCALLKNVAFENNLLLSALIIFAIGVLLLGIGLVFAKLVYHRVRLYALEGKAKLFGVKSKYTSHGAFLAILKKEWKDIVRTGTFAYYYLGVAITTPVMVFCCNRLVNKVGEAQVGGNLAYGVSILVLLSFMALINSFSAQAISRERETFYITKLTPCSFKTQLLSKAVINFAVAFGSLLISLSIITSLDFLSIGKSLLVLFISVVSATGIILNGFNLNLSNPDLTTSKSRESGQNNMNLLMIIGLLYAILQGGIAIVLNYLNSFWIVCIVNAAISIVYAGINALVFFVSAEKKYTKIEFR